MVRILIIIILTVLLPYSYGFKEDFEVYMKQDVEKFKHFAIQVNPAGFIGGFILPSIKRADALAEISFNSFLSFIGTGAYLDMENNEAAHKGLSYGGGMRYYMNGQLRGVYMHGAYSRWETKATFSKTVHLKSNTTTDILPPNLGPDSVSTKVLEKADFLVHEAIIGLGKRFEFGDFFMLDMGFSIGLPVKSKKTIKTETLDLNSVPSSAGGLGFVVWNYTDPPGFQKKPDFSFQIKGALGISF